MGYQCRACSYQGKQFPAGACPACGSHNIEPLKSLAEEPKKRNPYSLMGCIALWCYLIFAVIQKLWF